MTQERAQHPSLFRSNALNHLNIINETYIPFRIINPGSWLWILATALLLMSFMLWAILGRISITVPAIGIILPQNGQVLPIIATQQGYVSAIYVKEGKSVKKGTILAELFNPYLNEDLKYLQKVYEDNARYLAQLEEHTLKKKTLLADHFHRQEKILQESLSDHQEKLNTLQDLQIKKKALFKKHYLTLPEMNQAKEEVILAKKELAKTQSDLELAPIQYKEANDALDEKMNEHLAKVLESQHGLDKKILEKKNGAKIIASSDGIITASHISKGDYITHDKTLFTLVTNPAQENLETLVFVKHAFGKTISPGMDAYILPSALSAYEYGYIKGKVIEISEYPASKEAVYPYLGNMSLVEEFFKEGVPFLAKIQLSKTTATYSELKWTTKKGAPFKIKSGTTASVKIISKESSPLKLLTHRSLGG